MNWKRQAKEILSKILLCYRHYGQESSWKSYAKNANRNTVKIALTVLIGNMSKQFGKKKKSKEGMMQEMNCLYLEICHKKA